MTINGHLETAEGHSTGARTTPAKAMPAYEQIKRYVIARIEEGGTPERPIGTCMVSSEGACAAYYNFGRFAREREVV